VPTLVSFTHAHVFAQVSENQANKWSEMTLNCHNEKQVVGTSDGTHKVPGSTPHANIARMGVLRVGTRGVVVCPSTCSGGG